MGVKKDNRILQHTNSQSQKKNGFPAVTLKWYNWECQGHFTHWWLQKQRYTQLSAPQNPVAICIIQTWLFSSQSFYNFSSCLCNHLPNTVSAEKFFCSPCNSKNNLCLPWFSLHIQTLSPPGSACSQYRQKGVTSLWVPGEAAPSARSLKVHWWPHGFFSIPYS